MPSLARLANMARLSPQAQAVIRAAEIALGERFYQLRPGSARAFVKALPLDWRLEAQAAVSYTLREGKLPPIIAQVLQGKAA